MLRFQTAIEVGHIFNFGTRYSEPLEATFLDEDGAEKPLIGGSYGVGPARVMAAVVEQRHDENGIVWPTLDRPLRRARPRAARRLDDVLAEAEKVVMALGGERCRRALRRPRRAPREKFADADLIGCPARVIVGKKTLEDGAVDIRRATGPLTSAFRPQKW